MKAIPIAPILPVFGVALKAYKNAGGLNQGFVDRISVYTTGYHPSLGTFSIADAKMFWLGEIAGIVVHKVANKTGLNKYIRKGTMGFLQL